jgi:multidrug efflux system outer membrane protein
MNRIAIRIAPLLAALLLVACSTAPDLKPAPLDMPSAYKENADSGVWKMAQPAEAQQRGQWWLAFRDPALTALIDEATRANASLAVAAARVKQARALAGMSESERSVQLAAGLGAQRTGADNVASSSQYQARLSASYEVDLFGRVTDSISAARADAAASDATYQSILLSLQADVAQTYFRLRATDAELATLARSVDLRTQSVKVNQSRFDNGDIGEFDLARAKTELANARAEAIGLQRQRVQAEHALAVLLGKPAAMFSAEAGPLPEAAALPVIPPGVPSLLLQRRPDIVAAQRAMVASNARIGVAKAARFPSLLLNGGLGTDAASASNLFKWSAHSWVLGAVMSLPVIDGGRNKANVVRSEAVLEESVAAYRQNVLLAFAEVEDNLAGLRILAGQTEQIDAAVVSARRSADLAQKLYQAGRSSYLDLLDAQRNLAAVERSAVLLRGDRAVTTVALIRSLGGGWDQVAAK